MTDIKSNKPKSISALAPEASDPNDNAIEVPFTTTVGSRRAKGKIKYEAQMQRDEAALYFGALVSGLSAGHLHFKQGEHSLELSPADSVTVEVKASAKGSKQKVSFEVEWKVPEFQALDIAH